MSGTRENLTRRIARRPFRWFLGLWALLVGLWLLLGFVGFEWTTRPVRPPVPEAVPYADFLPGGKWYQSGNPMPIVADALPAFDPALLTNEYEYQAWYGPSGGLQLVAYQRASRSLLGWPQALVTWGRDSFFDVTDPTRPFERIAYFEDVSMRQPLGHAISWTWSNPDRTVLSHVILRTGLITSRIFQIELLVGIIVLVLWHRYGVVVGRRLRQKWCIHCGYNLRGVTSERCPECGHERKDSSRAKFDADRGHLLLPAGRVFAIITLLLIAASLLTMTEHDDLAAGLFGDPATVSIPPTKAPGSPPAQVDVKAGRYVLRWPRHWYVIQYWDEQTWMYPQNGPSQPGPARASLTRVPLSQGITLSFVKRDPSIMRTVIIFWPRALTALALLQFPALALTAVVVCAAAVWRRLRQRIDPNGAASEPAGV